LLPSTYNQHLASYQKFEVHTTQKKERGYHTLNTAIFLFPKAHFSVFTQNK